ncbi:MAG: amidohydrolase [Variovorax sp.]|nr:MAG: amidohydrolase [Variovorax sp.]
MTYDLKIINGRIIDGTGGPSVHGAVAIQDGRIVAMGDVPGDARRVLDAQGAVIAPGFVDIHTHYDAQLFWDPFLTISPWHGVTTAVIGSCGFGIAPTRPSGRDLILRTLERVEAMSLDALNAGLGEQWPFETFPEYLAAIEARGVAINLGVMIGHTPVRLYVMGAEAVEREATDDEVARMRALVLEGMQAGAIAFATSVSNVHIGFSGKPVPSRLASRAEMVALASAVGEAGSGIIHYNVARDPKFDDYVAVQEASGATVCWTAVLAGQLGPWRHREVLEKNRELRRQGYPIYPQVACRPIVSEFDFRSPVIFDTWLLFEPVRKATDEAARRALYADPGFRHDFREELAGRGGRDAFFSGGSAEGGMRRASFALTELSYWPGKPEWIGRRLVDIGTETGRHPVDVMLDSALESDLQARFRTPLVNFEEDEVQEILQDPDVVLGLGDGGAHLSQLCDACYPTHLLGHWVRERGAFSLEAAVHMMTGRTAGIFGLSDRGLLAVGRPADVVVFDPATVAAGPLQRVHDLPAGADRLISYPSGIQHVFVNGVELPQPDVAPAAGWQLPGRVLRHGHA